MTYFPASPIPEWPIRDLFAELKDGIDELAKMRKPAHCLSCGAKAESAKSLPCGH